MIGRGVREVVATGVVIAGLLAGAGAAQADAPANDNFASAQVLTAGPDGKAAATGDNTSATREPSEPAHYYSQREKSLWYRWVAPADGVVVVDTQGSTFDTVLAAYTGSSLASLTSIASNDDYYGLQSRVRFPVSRGTEYSIAVASYSGSAGAVKVQLEYGTAPANDAFASARDLGLGLQASATGSTLGGSREVSEPRGTDSSYGDSSVWYSWTAPSSGVLTADTAGSAFNTVLGIYTGTGVNSLTRVGGNDDAGPATRTSRASVRVEAGTTYRIQVDGYQSGDSGAVNLNLSLGEGPANDLFALAQPLTGDRTVSTTGNNAGATAELGEPNLFSYEPTQASVWYAWTAPSTGSLTIRTTADFQTVITAYTGSALTGLNRVNTQTQQGFNGGPEQVRIRVEAGTTYRIQVAGRYGASGTFGLSLNLLDTPANDDFSNAITLASQLNLSVAGNNLNATQQVGEPTHDDNYCDPSVWYSWTAPATGGLTLDTAGSDIRTVVGVYTGSELSSLTRVPTTRVSGTANGDFRVFQVQAGVTYRIAVDGLCGAMGNFRLSFGFSPPPANDLFALASPLPSTGTVAVSGTNAGAGVELGEPNPFSYDPVRSSVWYAWTAPSTGSLTIRTNAQFQSVITAYTGDALTGLNRVTTQTQQGFNGGAEQVRIRVEAGTTYRIQIGARYGLPGTFDLSLNLAAPPANDDFSNAISLASQLDLSVTGTNLNATQQVGEPTHDDNYCDPSVWYSWTAPATGGLTLDTAGSAIRTVVGVYTGTELNALTRVPTYRRATTSNGDARTFRVEAGVTYRIAVDGLCGAMGDFRLAFSFSLPPANDLFSLAEPVEGDAATASGDLSGATGEANEPTPGGSAGASVWYSWRAPRDGVAMATATSSQFSPAVQAFTGDSLLGLASVPTSSGAFTAQAGTLYRIRVHGGSRPDRGPFTLSVNLYDTPANDAFANPAQLTGTSATAAGDLRGASYETGEPGWQSPSVWYSWRAPATGATTIRATGSSYAAATVYTGDSVNGLSYVYGGNGTFRAQEGTLYRIAVRTETYYTRGTFSLSLEQFPTPANDDFAAAEQLTGDSPSKRGWTTSSSLEQGESFDGPYSVWYSWTAPRSGRTTVDMTPENGNYVVSAVYTGSSISQRTMLTSDHHGGSGGASRLSFDAVAGRTYRIAVGSCGEPGAFRLNLQGPPPPPANPPANDPPADDPPANDPPASDPPASDTPADDPPASDDTPTSTDRPTVIPQPGTGAAWQPASLPTWWPAPQQEQPQASRQTAPQAPAALDIQAAFPPAQRLSQVFRRGFRGAAACTRDCSLEITAGLTDVAGAARAPKVRASLRAPAGAGRGFVLRLPKAVQRKLGRARSPSLSVQLVARSGGQSRSVTRRVVLRR